MFTKLVCNLALVLSFLCTPALYADSTDLSNCDTPAKKASVDDPLYAQTKLLHDTVNPVSLADLPVACVEDVVAQYAPKSPTDASDAMELSQLIYDSADQLEMPPTVLLGAMMQETHLEKYSVGKDYGNYSCGIGQINVNDWCHWAVTASDADRNRIDWPIDQLKAFQKKNRDLDLCDTEFLVPEHTKAFFNLLTLRQQTATATGPGGSISPDLVMIPARIQYKDVKKDFDAVTAAHYKANADDKLEKTSNAQLAQKLRFEITRNFVEHCSDPRNGIPAIGTTLKKVFDQLPKEIREAQQFASGDKHKPSCPHMAKANAFPLQVGWLLADAVYNAGEDILPGIYAYQKQSQKSWNEFGPQDLVNAITYSVTLPDTTISAVGAAAAKNHIRGVVRNMTQAGQSIIQ